MKKKSSIILVILWMAFIFVMSSFSASESSSQSGKIVNFIASLFNISNVSLLSYIVRKLAHFTEYFILGVFVANMFNRFNKLIYLGIIVCFLYAVSDEVHQLFVLGRSCQIIDILIDSIGATLAVIIFKKYQH